MCFPHLSCFTTTLCPSLSSSFTLLSRLLSPYINTNLPHIFLYFTYSLSLSYSLTQNTFPPLSLFYPLSLTYSFSLMHTIPQSLSLSPSHNLSHLSIFQLLFLSLSFSLTQHMYPLYLSLGITHTLAFKHNLPTKTFSNRLRHCISCREPML